MWPVATKILDFSYDILILKSVACSRRENHNQICLQMTFILIFHYHTDFDKTFWWPFLWKRLFSKVKKGKKKWYCSILVANAITQRWCEDNLYVIIWRIVWRKVSTLVHTWNICSGAISLCSLHSPLCTAGIWCNIGGPGPLFLTAQSYSLSDQKT